MHYRVENNYLEAIDMSVEVIRKFACLTKKVESRIIRLYKRHIKVIEITGLREDVARQVK